MLSTNNQELFEQYYQREYDFNTSSLSQADIFEIKQLAKEKRVDYALAPMGTSVFNWIIQQNDSVRIELVKFDSDNIDGLLYIPRLGKERAYIVLNANKPLANQIFTAAHEFYHYVKDYQLFKNTPYICDFSALKDVNEMKASRFAAELLLPEEALRQEVYDYCRYLGEESFINVNFENFAVLSIFLTIKYQMPLKAVLYRLWEEKYSENIDKYIKNYDFIKWILLQIRINGDRVRELYSTENKYVNPSGQTYQNMEIAFYTGYASREEIIRDAEVLEMDADLINDMIGDDENEEENDDDLELFSIIKGKTGCDSY